MAICTCYIYPEAQDKTRSEFVDFLVKGSGWDRDKVVAFLNTNDQVSFSKVEKEKAIALIETVEKLGIVGSIDILDKSYQKKFKKFKDGYKPTWNWFAALFSWLWFLTKGLWGKIAIYSMISWLLSMIVPRPIWGLLAWPVSFAYFGLFGSFDYYLQKVKGEPFWPKFSYKKVKLPFWIVFLLFLGYAVGYPLVGSLKTIAGTSEKTISKFTYDNLSFETVPKEWRVYENPPTSFSVKIARPVGKGQNETLAYGNIPDTRLIAIAQKETSGAKTATPLPTEELRVKVKVPLGGSPTTTDQTLRTNIDYENLQGLVGLVIKKSSFFEKFDGTRSEGMVNVANALIGSGGYPSYLKWLERWFPVTPAETTYQEISGREWGKITKVSEFKMFGMNAKFHQTCYWTAVNGQAIILLTQAFNLHQNAIETEAVEFLGALKVQ